MAARRREPSSPAKFSAGLFFAGAGFVIFFLAAAYLLGREYFELAAMRYHPVAEAKALRKMNQSKVFAAGLFIAAFVSIPIVNLATPLFAMAFMTHIHKQVAKEQRIVTARSISTATRHRSSAAAQTPHRRAAGLRVRGVLTNSMPKGQTATAASRDAVALLRRRSLSDAFAHSP
jgi:dipeptide/tripeptide permease